VVALDLMRLPRLGPSRRVRFTKRFTQPIFDLRVSVFTACATARTPAWRFIPSPSAHSYGERVRLLGQGGAAHRTNDLAGASGLLGFAWTDGDGVNRLPASTMRQASADLRPSMEPEVPAGGFDVRACRTANRSAVRR